MKCQQEVTNCSPVILDGGKYSSNKYLRYKQHIRGELDKITYAKGSETKLSLSKSSHEVAIFFS